MGSNDKNVVMHKRGNGRLYYRIAMYYTPTSLQLNAVNYVTLTMTTTQRRYHVALVDYLPAGCEPLNTKLNGTMTDYTNSSVTRSKRSSRYSEYRLNSTIGW
ncbi:unnamed protein product, partial [Rotaria magnacalcarata]